MITAVVLGPAEHPRLGCSGQLDMSLCRTVRAGTAKLRQPEPLRDGGDGAAHHGGVSAQLGPTRDLDGDAVPIPVVTGCAGWGARSTEYVRTTHSSEWRDIRQASDPRDPKRPLTRPNSYLLADVRYRVRTNMGITSME